MPTYLYYTEKGLIYIIIIDLSSRQFFFYTKCIKLNMRFSCNVCLVSDAKYIFFCMFLYFLKSITFLFNLS